MVARRLDSASCFSLQQEEEAPKKPSEIKITLPDQLKRRLVDDSVQIRKQRLVLLPRAVTVTYILDQYLQTR